MRQCLRAEDRLDSERFREALARWPSGVAIVAFRDTTRVVGTTVSAFTSLSVEPPLVLVALGANATVLPFLAPGAAFGISVLTRDQARLATVFADPYPVGATPFAADGPPLVDGALVGLACSVVEVRGGGDHTIVIAGVDAATLTDDEPLVRFRRRYHGIAP